MKPPNLPARYLYQNKAMQGGQGTVFVFHDSFLNRDVAVKVLNPQNNAAIKHELKCLSEIHSSRVAEVYDLIEEPGGALALVQEYVPGPNLDEYLGLPMKAPGIRTLWQISKGIEDIHHSGKIHRDLKPENIRFDLEGILKVLDFGLAMEITSSITVQLRGSRNFAAPELFGPPPVTLTPSADIYALGIFAWYICNNKTIPSFLWDSRRDATRPTVSISTALNSVSPELIKLLDAAVARDPLQRPSASDIRHQLQREVLRGQHRMHITYDGNQTVLQKAGERATLRFGNLNATVMYSGTDFYFESCTSDVYINNKPMKAGDLVPGSCVVTIGTRGKRMFVAIDVSHPGIS